MTVAPDRRRIAVLSEVLDQVGVDLVSVGAVDTATSVRQVLRQEPGGWTPFPVRSPDQDAATFIFEEVRLQQRRPVARRPGSDRMAT